MPLSERDPNVSGRESRASNFSGKVSVSGKTAADTLSAGVLGMLKTSTETGDIGSLSFQPRRLPKISHGPLPRHPSQKNSRPPSQFSRSASVRSKASNHSTRSANDPPVPGSWPYSHFPSLRSQDIDRSNKEARPYTPQESTRSLALSSDRYEPSDRSQSITPNLRPVRSLNYHQSLTSLRSQEAPPRPRSPFAYPSRLRRPGYRPGSPALSDKVPLHQRPNTMRPGPAPRAHSTSPLPPPNHRDLGYRQANTKSTPLLRMEAPPDGARVDEHEASRRPYGYSQHTQASRFNQMMLPSTRPAVSSHLQSQISHFNGMAFPQNQTVQHPQPLVSRFNGATFPQARGPMVEPLQPLVSRFNGTTFSEDQAPTLGHPQSYVSTSSNAIAFRQGQGLMVEHLQPHVSRFNGSALPSDQVPINGNFQQHVSRFNGMTFTQVQPSMAEHQQQMPSQQYNQSAGSQMYRSVDEYRVLPPVQAQPSQADRNPYAGFVQRVKTVLEERIPDNETEHLSEPGEQRSSVAEPPAVGSTSPIMTSIALGMIEAPETPVMEIVPSANMMVLSSEVVSEDVSISPAVIEGSETPVVEITADTPPSTPTIKRLTRDMIKQAVDTTSDRDVVTSDTSYEPSIMHFDTGNSTNDLLSKRHSGIPPSLLPEAQPDPDQSEEEDNAEHRESRLLQRDSAGEATNTSTLDFPGDFESFSRQFSIRGNLAPDLSQTVKIDGDVTESCILGPRDSIEVAHSHNVHRYDRPLSLPKPSQETQSQRGHGQTLSLPVVMEHRQVTSFDASAYDHGTAAQNAAASQADEAPADEPGMATVFPAEESQEEDYTIISTIVNPASYTDSGQWATPSIVGRGSYIPVIQRSERASVSSIHGRLNPWRSSDTSSTPAITPSNRRSSIRLSTSSEHEVPASTTAGTVPITTDARNTALRHFQFPLPDLTEDSQEDASTTNLRMLGARPSGFRSGGSRGMRLDGRPTNRVSLQPEQPRSYLSRTGQGVGEMPTLNFSHSDLTARLNQALGLRSSRSLEELKRLKRQGMVLTHERSASSGSVIKKERYRSFFMSCEEPAEDDQTATDIIAKITANDELLSEINRMSIPSVNNLTIRLSELLPSIKVGRELDPGGNDEAVKKFLDEGHDADAAETGSSASPMSDGPILADHRPNGAQPNTLHLMKELPPLPRDKSNKQMSVVSSPSGALSVAAAFESKEPMDSAEVAELEAPNQHSEHEQTPLAKVDPYVAKTLEAEKKSMLSLKDADTDVQPWRKDGSHPWSEHTATMDITLPTQNTTGSPATRPLIKSKTSRSTMDVSMDDGTRIARAMSPGFKADADLIPFTDGPELEHSTPLRKGILGSLSRKIGLRPRIDKAGFPIDPAFLHPEERHTDPGDRYPTTGLTPPAGLNIEENRSFFSDDSSRSERVVSLRKRLVRRTRPKPINIRPLSPATSKSDTHRATNHWVTSGSVFGTDSNIVINASQVDATQPDVVILYEKTPHGMSKIEFRAKRLLEKLRVFWFKSGEVFRNKHRAHTPTWYEASEVVAVA